MSFFLCEFIRHELKFAPQVVTGAINTHCVLHVVLAEVLLGEGGGGGFAHFDVHPCRGCKMRIVSGDVVLSNVKQTHWRRCLHLFESRKKA